MPSRGMSVLSLNVGKRGISDKDGPAGAPDSDNIAIFGQKLEARTFPGLTLLRIVVLSLRGSRVVYYSQATTKASRVRLTADAKMIRTSLIKTTPDSVRLSTSFAKGCTHVEGLVQESADKASDLLMVNHAKFHTLFNEVGLHSTSV